MDAVALLVSTLFRFVINEANIEDGYARFCALAPEAIDEAAFREAVATALREKLIHEPIRLPEGALQCHWHLELTPKGVAMARDLPALRDPGPQAGDVYVPSRGECPHA